MRLLFSILFALTFLVTSLNAQAQEIVTLVENQEIPVKRLYGMFMKQQQLQQSQQQQTTFRLNNCHITFGDSDVAFLDAVGDYPDESEDGFENTVQKPRFDFNLEFRNCRFNEDVNSSVQLSHMYFTGVVSVHNSSGYGIRFAGVDFWNSMEVYDVDFRYLEFSSCHFLEALYLNDNQLTQFNITDSDFIRNNRSKTFGFNFENRNIFYSLNIRRCEFLDNSRESMEIHDVDTLLHENSLVKLKNFDAEHLTIDRCVFDCTLLMAGMAVSRSASLTDNRYYHKIAFDQAPLLPSEGSVIPYEPIEGRIGTLTPLTEGYLRFYRYDDEREYRVDFRRPWVDIDVEKKIVPVYSKLLEIYRSNSDIQSYNACYNQMKRIEKTVSKIRYQSNERFIDWFRWKMDIFLEKFSAYGTDPVLSLYNSLLCILAFAALYALIPSEEDNLRFHNMQRAVYRYVSHFSLQKKHFYSADELYQRELAAANRMREKLIQNLDSLPPVVARIGLPFHKISLAVAGLKRRVRSFIRFNVYQDWSSQARWGRARISAIISLNFLGFILWGIIMRVINSFTLSLNAFVTLGYGEIEAKGLARYFCVVEGLIGWFLLSIFSVSLISQILH